MMLCPICDSELTETEYCSKIYSVNNKYCPHCHSFHITKQNIEDVEYYNKIYHADFKYKIGELKRKLLQFFPVFAFRSMARFDFLKKHVEVKSLSTIIEIGGGTGETFWVFNKKISSSATRSLNRVMQWVYLTGIYVLLTIYSRTLMFNVLTNLTLC